MIDLTLHDTGPHSLRVREFYLGQAGSGEAKSFKDIKHYKRRKRWLA